MTYLQIVNAVLRRLRETQVSSVDDTTYTALIGDFVNETKREVEAAWNWSMLRTSVDVTTVADTTGYSLTGSGKHYKILTVQNVSGKFDMYQVPAKWIWDATAYGTPGTGRAIYYTVDGVDSNGDSTITIYPTPDSAETLRFYLVVPQADLETDTTEVSVPSWPIVLGAISKAMTERGEDNSNTLQEHLMRYNSALTEAIAQDAARFPDELIWSVY